MNGDEQGLAQAEKDLEQALRLLSGTGRYDAYDWILIATLVGEADLAIRQARALDPSIEVPLFEIVLKEFLAETDNFRNAEFLRCSRAARRRNPGLFRIP